MDLYIAIVWEFTANILVAQAEKADAHCSKICGKLFDDRTVYVIRIDEPDTSTLVSVRIGSQ